MENRSTFHSVAEQRGVIRYFCLSNQGHSQAAAHRFPLLFTGNGFRADRDVGLCNLVQPNISIPQTQLGR